MADLIRRALEVNQAYFALGNECFEADGATFIRNRAVPLRDANHVTHITASTDEEINRLLARVEQEFAGFPYRCFHVDSTTPPALEARLLMDDYQRGSVNLVMLLEGALIASPKRYDIQPITDEAGWDLYAALRHTDWHEFLERVGRSEGEHIARGLLQLRRAQAPPVRFWLAYINGEPRAYCSSWVGPGSLGFLDYLFVHPDFRHRGLATTLIHHCVAECWAQGVGPVMLLCDATDTPKHMYAAMGFRPIAIKREYWKNVEL